MFRTVGDRPSLWESLLPAEVLRLPEELARVDALLDDPAFFAPFAPHFHPVLGRPSTPVECYLRLMFLKFRYRLGYESLCAEVSDSISWRRFCRIPLDGKVPHPTTLMKLTTRCGEAAVAGLNEALLAKAAGAKLLRTARVRADTTVIPANVAYPTDSGLLAKAVGKLVRTARRVQAAGGATGTVMTDRRRAAARRVREIASKLRSRGQAGPGGKHPGDPPGDRRAGRSGGEGRGARPPRCCATAAGPCPGPSAAGCGAGCGGRWTSWRSPSSAPPRSWRRPGPGWPGRCRTARPGWSACTTPMPGRSARAASTVRSSSGTRPRSPTTTTASSWTTPSNTAPPRTARSWRPPSSGSPAAPAACPARSPPTAATASPPSNATCTTSGVRTVAIPRQATTSPARKTIEHSRGFRTLVKWRTGCEGRISYLKRGYGWDRTRLDGRHGAAIWCGHGVFAHNLVKISALAS